MPLPADAIGLIAGVNMAVGLFAFAGATAGDFARFARTRKDAVLSCIVGVIPAALVALLAGAALAIVTGQGDIAVIMSSIGLPAVGLIALVLSAWTVNASNVYSAGLGFAVMLGKGEGGSKLTTAVSGVAGIVLAVGGILGQFEAFLAVALVTGGTFALVPGLQALDVPFFVGPVNGIVVAMAAYVAAYRLTGGERFAGPIAFKRPAESAIMNQVTLDASERAQEGQA